MGRISPSQVLGWGRKVPAQPVPSAIEWFCFFLGKHEEKQDEHGFISRCFTRKYT